METSKDISTQKGKYINTDSGRDQSGSIKLFYAAVIRRAGQDHDNQQRQGGEQEHSELPPRGTEGIPGDARHPTAPQKNTKNLENENFRRSPQSLPAGSDTHTGQRTQPLLSVGFVRGCSMPLY